MTPYEQTRREIAIEADRVLAERFPEYRDLSPEAQRLAVAVDQHARLDDDPTVTVVDTGERSGVRLARYDWSGTPAAWLEFSAGDLLATVDLGDGQPGVEITLSGWGGSRYRPLADLRRLRDDLDRLLRDERLVGALAEQG